MTRTVDPLLARLRQQVVEMGRDAEAILDKALRALRERSPELAEEVQADDLELDRLDLKIDEGVLRALALQAPVAEDLRQVVSSRMIATDLERVGDLARNIAKAARRLAERDPVRLPDGLLELAELARAQLRAALDAYGASDVARAREVLDGDDAVDQKQDEVVREVIREIAVEPELAPQRVDFVLIAETLERIGDHATNIAEDVILSVEARNVKHARKLARALGDGEGGAD